MALVSVIIPCFNSERYLKETIQSVVNQTYPFTEIICVDNGSTDNTLELINSLQQKIPQLKLEIEKKKGASYARCKGLSVAKGTFIQFLDSDDIILPLKFETQVKAINDNEWDWVVSDRAVMNEDFSKKIESHHYNHFIDDPLTVAIAQVITSGNPLYKTDAVNKVNGYTSELKVGQDWDFHIKLILASTKFGYVAGEFFQSRTVQGSLSSNWYEVSKVLCKLIESYKNNFNEKGIKSRAAAVQKIQQVYYFTALATKNKKEVSTCLSELKFWSEQIPLSTSLGKKDKFLLALFGLSKTVNIRRIFSKKED